MTLALSVRQPWPWLMFHAGKGVENRDWPTKVRGHVLIHASKGMTRSDYEDAWDTAALIFRREGWPKETIPERSWFLREATGGIVGEAEIVDCVEQSDSPWFFGRYGFVLRNAKPLPFRPYKGRLGFFEIDEAALYRKTAP